MDQGDGVSSAVGPSAQAGALRALADGIEEIEADFHKIHSKREAKGVLWADDSSGRLGVRARTDLVYRCWKYLHPALTKAQIAADLFHLKGLHPHRTKGDHSGDATMPGAWPESTWLNYLENKDIRPRLKEAEAIYQGTVRLFAQALPSMPGSKPDLMCELPSQEVSAYYMVRLLLQAGGLTGEATWIKPPAFKPLITGSLAHSAHPIESAKLKAMAIDALSFLKEAGTRRAVVISGAARSGRRTILRLMLEMCPDKELDRNDGESRMPILAAAMEDSTPDEFIDLVYDYYKAADRQVTHDEARTADLHAWVKVDRIGEMAKRTPACVVLAGVEPIDDHEIVRNLKGSRIDAVILAVLRGHRLNRVVFTVKQKSERLLLHKLREHCGTNVKSLRVLARTEARDRQGLPPYLRTVLPADFKASGVSWVLAGGLLELAAERIGFQQDVWRLQREVEVALHGDDSTALVGTIFRTVLRQDERIMLGLLSCSYDGLRLSVLVRMLEAFNRIAPGDGFANTLSAAECERVLGSLATLVSRRIVRVDAALTFHGEPESELLYGLDDAWRHTFQAEWRAADLRGVQLGMWLVAREAVHQARCMRVLEAGRKSPRLLGRDIQALYALIASIDIAGLSGSKGRAELPQHPEDTVLPPLGRDAEPPDPTIAIRFALLQLYRKDLEGDGFRLLTVLEDARARLGVLLAFFEPHSSWRRLDEWYLAPTWDNYLHLLDAFSLTELTEMLTSVALAAQRLQRFDLVSSAARLGESLLRRDEVVAGRLGSEQVDPNSVAAAVPPIEVMRLLRAEIDIGLLLGGNPDAFFPRRAAGAPGRGVQLCDVVSRAQAVLNEWFAAPNSAENEKRSREVLIARGKLFARLGEINHVAGRREDARAAFEAALQAERRVLGMMPLANYLNPILGGRGIRSLLRFELDAAWHQSSAEGRTPLRFDDGLMLPEPRWLPENDEAIQRATCFLYENARRLARGRAVDAIGIRVDAARLAATRYDFRRALSHMDAAFEMPRGTDPNLETLLELAAVSARVVLDAAVLCLLWDDPTRHPTLYGAADAATSLDGLRQHFDLPGGSGLDLAERLLGRADRHRDTLERLGSQIQQAYHPYGIYAIYLAGFWHAVRSRCDIAGRRNHMQQALELLERAYAQMLASQYEMHLAEVTLVLEGLRVALGQVAPVNS